MQKKKKVLLIPGWGCLSSWFDFLSQIVDLSVMNYSAHLFDPRLVKNEIFDGEYDQVIGVSAGARMLWDVAQTSAFPAVPFWLFGFRPQYPNQDLLEFRSRILKNKRAALAGFFMASIPAGDGRVLDSAFLDDVLHYWTDEALFAGLDYIGSDFSTRESGALLHFVHGENDQIAPVSEMRSVANAQPGASIHIHRCGHLPFFDTVACQYVLDLLEENGGV